MPHGPCASRSAVTCWSPRKPLGLGNLSCRRFQLVSDGNVYIIMYVMLQLLGFRVLDVLQNMRGLHRPFAA